MLDVLVVATAMSAGALCGWWLRGAENRESGPGGRSDSADEMMARLRKVAENVAVNLGEHHTRMREIHEQLKEAADKDPEEIVAVVTRLLESSEWMQEQLQTAEERLEQQAAQIASHAAEARTDALTQLANRRAFDDAMLECQAAHDEERIPATVMLMDVDHFKKFNDTHGHQAGDEVLRGVARVLRRHIPSPNLVTRYGGEEFAVIFPGQRYAEVRALAEKARAAVAEARFRFEGLLLHVSSSAGVAEFLNQEAADALLKRADEALYASKEAGRDCGHFHAGNRVVPLTRMAPGEQVTPVDHGPVSDLKPEAVDFEKADFVAGVSNENLFLADVNRRLSEFRRGGAQLSVLFAKVDDFEALVRRHGAEAGRIVTRAATLFIKATMRDMDHVARFHDGTFSLMLPGANLEGAMAVAERLRQAASRCQLPEHRFPPRQFTLSVGVAQAAGQEDGEILLDRVRLSLDAAMKHGRNCCYIHNGENCQLVGAGNFSLH